MEVTERAPETENRIASESARLPFYTPTLNWYSELAMLCGESSFPVVRVESRSFIPVRLGCIAKQRARTGELQIARPSKSVRLAHVTQ